jgi:hypothetical protein
VEQQEQQTLVVAVAEVVQVEHLDKLVDQV